MSILDIVFPKICSGCGREGEYICLKCQTKLVKPEGICPMCCKPSLGGWTHPRCRAKLGMERLMVGLPYRGMVQDCLKKVKYKSAWEIINFLHGLGNFPELKGVVTSIPMWREKERERGFNQAEILARLMGKNIGLLERVRETKPMFGLDRKKRQVNIEGAFAISQRLTANNIQQSRVILVDDVWTTGSTMRECARVLKGAGIEEIWGVTLAR